MRMICLIALAGLVSACGNTDEPASGPTGPEPADAASGPAAGADSDTGIDIGGDVAAIDGAIASDDAAISPAAAQTAGGGGGGPARAGEIVSSLPLRTGFYVAADITCGQASNATLQLLRRDGINTSRTPCDFQRIEKIGSTSFRVTERCTDGGPAWGTEEQVHTSTAIYEIESDTRFKVVGDSWESAMQFCAQSSLPEPWRNNDISDITG